MAGFCVVLVVALVSLCALFYACSMCSCVFAGPHPWFDRWGDIWRAPSPDLARQLVNLREPRPGKPTLGLFYRVAEFFQHERGMKPGVSQGKKFPFTPKRREKSLGSQCNNIIDTRHDLAAFRSKLANVSWLRSYIYTPVLDGRVGQLEVRMDNVEKRCESMDSKLDKLVTATCENNTPKLRKRPLATPCPEGLMAGMTTWFVTQLNDSDKLEAQHATVLTVDGEQTRAMPWSNEGLPRPGVEIQGDKSHPMTEEEARNTALN